jgi:hypothetical protein
LRFNGQIDSDFAELFQRGFDVFDDFLGEDVGIGKILQEPRPSRTGFSGTGPVLMDACIVGTNPM